MMPLNGEQPINKIATELSKSMQPVHSVKNDLEDALSGSNDNSAESNTAAVDSLPIDTSNITPKAIEVALAADIPREHIMTFASLLKGETVEELAKHALTLKSLFIQQEPEPKFDKATDRSQGMGGSTAFRPEDPLLESLIRVVGHY